MENRADAAGAAYGRGMAGLIMTFFGAVWLAWGFATLPAASHFPTAAWAALTAMAVVLIGFAESAVRRGRALMRAQGASRDEFWSRRGKPFRIVTILEVLGIFVVIILANIFHRPEWIPVGVSFVVGLHFIPLGSVFGFPGYYFVGGAICAWDIACVAALRPSNSGAPAELGTGVILWITAVTVLVRSNRAAHKLANA